MRDKKRFAVRVAVGFIKGLEKKEAAGGKTTKSAQKADGAKKYECIIILKS